MSVKAYPTKNVNELWLLKDVLLSVGGGMGHHLCIAQVGFERGCGVFLYNVSVCFKNALLSVCSFIMVCSYDDVNEEC